MTSAIRSITIATKGEISRKRLNELLELIDKGSVKLGTINGSLDDGQLVVLIGGTRPLSEIKTSLQQLPYVIDVRTVDDPSKNEDERKPNEKVA